MRRCYRNDRRTRKCLTTRRPRDLGLKVAEISNRKSAERAATKAASEGTSDARDQRLG
jgi:hypothetical protein